MTLLSRVLWSAWFLTFPSLAIAEDLFKKPPAAPPATDKTVPPGQADPGNGNGAASNATEHPGPITGSATDWAAIRAKAFERIRQKSGIDSTQLLISAGVAPAQDSRFNDPAGNGNSGQSRATSVVRSVIRRVVASDQIPKILNIAASTPKANLLASLVLDTLRAATRAESAESAIDPVLEAQELEAYFQNNENRCAFVEGLQRIQAQREELERRRLENDRIEAELEEKLKAEAVRQEKELEKQQLLSKISVEIRQAEEQIQKLKKRQNEIELQ